jgi:hypothetical protein
MSSAEAEPLNEDNLNSNAVIEQKEPLQVTENSSNENNVQISLNALDLANDESKSLEASPNPTNEPVSSEKLMTKSMSAISDNTEQDKENKEKGNQVFFIKIKIQKQHSLINTFKYDLEQDASSQPNSYETEINRLKELLSQKDIEISNLEAKLNEQEQHSKQQIELLHQNFTAKLEQTLKKFQDMQKDKTSSMVMKYAEAEKKNIDLHRSNELLQSKLNDSGKEKQRLVERLEKSKLELEALNADNDKKLKEILALKKENEKMREQFVLNDAKENAAQIKLRNEIESHLNTRKQLEQVNRDLIDLKKRLENEAVKSEEPSTSDECVTEVKTDEVVVGNGEESSKPRETETITKSNSGNSLAPPKSASTEKITPEKDKTVRELYALKSQLKDMFEERTTLRDRLQCLEQERKLQEISLSKYKETLQSQKQMNKELLNEILQLRELQETLTK